ncbi:hypothetical protein BpHYR1_003915 [Brachionus plicatilis]|uniref:Uncharacterized protein n=1 Tax=Brachionus plicatilis TaxID=10195 RepID=A0A3M7RET3_BRAPC|nr:hypothetical protein BpHYR1_003915 [Brachionus plicatilis]
MSHCHEKEKNTGKQMLRNFQEEERKSQHIICTICLKALKKNSSFNDSFQCPICRDTVLSKNNCQHSKANLTMNNSRTTLPTTPTTTTSPRDIVETHTNVRQNNSTPTHDCGGFLIVVSFVCFILFFVLISVLSSVLPHHQLSYRFQII